MLVSGSSTSQKSEFHRLQCFIFEQYENVYHFLSQCCVTFGHDFYKQPNIAEAISSTLFVVRRIGQKYQIVQSSFYNLLA